MSLFITQLKIPFQSVIRWLRYLEPGSDMSPDMWARRQAEDIAPGDILFIWEIMYSPWGDSSVGIGVADGDTFRVSHLFFVTKWESQTPVGYVVANDTFERQAVPVYFEQCAAQAKQNGTGFYYTLVRSNPPLTADRLSQVEALDAYGPNGWRTEDQQNPDLPYAFFQAAGYGVEARGGMILPIDQLGFALFCDKEPPPGSPVPDIRRFTAPVYKDASRSDGSVSDEAPAQPPEPSVPKMPSFFSQGPKRVSNPLSALSGLGAAFSGGGSVPPPPPAFEDEPAPVASEIESEAPHVVPYDEAPGQTHGEQQSDSQPSPPEAPLWGTHDEAPASVPQIDFSSSESRFEPALHVEPQPESIHQPLPDPVHHSLPEPPPLESQAHLEPPMVDFDSPSDETPPSMSVPSIKAPRIVPPRPSGGLPPVPSRNVPPIPAGMTFDMPVNVEESASSEVEPVAEAEVVPEAPAARQDLKETVEIEQSSIPAYLQEPPKTPGVEDIMAAIDTTIKETTEARKAELRAEAANQRVRPGRQQPPQPEPVVEPKQEAVDEGETAAEAAVADVDLPPGPPKKKRPDPAEAARAQELQKMAQLKEPMAVKSGVAGLVSKLEQQASKASVRLETQVDDIQARLSEELGRLMNKVQSTEKRSAKSAEGLRINLTGKMDGVAGGVRSQVADAASEGAQTIKSAEQNGAGQLDDKHEYLRTSLAGSFDEVRARAEMVSKSFEESLASESRKTLESLDEMRERWSKEFDSLETEYSELLQATFDTFKERVSNVTASATTVINDRHNVFESQLADLQERHLRGLQHTRTMLLSKLGRQFVVAEMEIHKLQANAMDESLLPKLCQHREELRVVTTEFQHKLSQDLAEKGDQKISEFEPILTEKKEKLLELLKETTTVKDSIQEQLRKRLEEIYVDLQEFVEVSIDQAETAFKTTEEQLADIDREVRALADPSTIEGDQELLSERNSVLVRLDQVTEDSKENVLNTLRSNLAALEERGKSLQEELISSMEEDAYVVRRASEQALASIREAIRDSFGAIQTAQDERMPM